MRATFFGLFKRGGSPPIAARAKNSLSKQQNPESLCDEDGYIIPKSAEQLLAVEHRSVLVDRIWEQTSVSKNSFEKLYREPIKRYAELVQELPASESHHHSYLGGMLDHTLEILLYSLRLRQSYLLPLGSPPEEQAQHSDAWTAGVAYGGLLHDIGKVFCDIRVETRSGAIWFPWQGQLKEPYRFKYIPGRDYNLHNAAASLLCHQVLGSEVLDWLAKNPPLWGSLLYLLSGNYSEAGVLGEIVAKADRTSTALNIGANPEKALKAPPTSLQSHLIRGLRQLLKDDEHRLKLNTPGAAGWLTQEGLWLVSKVVSDKLRAFLLAQGVDKIPSKNSSLFDELQSHRIIEPNADGNAIWKATVTDGSWKQEFTFLRVKPSLIWGSEEYPDAFTGSITLDSQETPDPQSDDKESSTDTGSTAAEPTASKSSKNVKSNQAKKPETPAAPSAQKTKQNAPSMPSSDDGIDELLSLMGIGGEPSAPEVSAEPWLEPPCAPKAKPSKQEDAIPFEENTVSIEAVTSPDKPAASQPLQKENADKAPPKAKSNNSPSSANNTSKSTNQNNKFSDKLTTENLGQYFIDWLKDSISKRTIYMNDSRAQVHIVDSKVFLVTPGIFQRFASQFPELQKLNSDPDIKEWRVVQKAFEGLQLHIKREDDLNIWQCSVRGPRVKGNNLNGYMLPINVLLSSKPHDNPFITLKKNESKT